jgi:hypothetical protein
MWKSGNQELKIYNDKEDNRDASLEFAFLPILLLSERYSALLQIVFRVNRFDISLVMV